MNFFAFAPIAGLLDGASHALDGVSHSLAPIAGASSAALAIVLVTLALRTVLIPVGVSQVRAQRVRTRLAPRVADLRRRHARHTARLQRELAALYASEKASPAAGCLPALLQAPILSGVYTLFTLPIIAGHGNVLLAHSLFGAPLGTSLVAAFGSGSVLAIAVPAVVVALIAVVALVNRHRTVLLAGGTAGRTAAILSWLPLVTVLFAALAPLAASVYLLTSTTWTVLERAILLHLIPA
ncbi:YidC/Oxa1 family membrane protein insertase [Glaciibacter flavus]|uniref:Membrane protein insertase YidC n=1 Tax=Orlajensenia flava TaxID=2565934 RepID=A0A4S4FYT7_9MICO|nr:membrane protein insertase YidC [Glaciibacter flavus]THG35531.1 YidC/Oxa1 family membrane protein insertase [Glaciibacter flavus]